MTTDVDKIRKAFNNLRLFKTPDEIAAYFESLGIKAEPGDGDHCAVSQYMKQNGADAALTSSNHGWYYPVDEDVEVEFEWEKDSPISLFIEKFDDYGYKGLVADVDFNIVY